MILFYIQSQLDRFNIWHVSLGLPDYTKICYLLFRPGYKRAPIADGGTNENVSYTTFLTNACWKTGTSANLAHHAFSSGKFYLNSSIVHPEPIAIDHFDQILQVSSTTQSSLLLSNARQASVFHLLSISTHPAAC